MLEAAKRWARALKVEIGALFIAGRDPRTPLAARLVAIAVAAYALSPIDLIPDFIPVLGLLDDLLIVPLGILLAVRLIPEPLMAEFRAAAGSRPPPSRAGGAVVIALWLIGAAVLLWWLFRAAPAR